MKKITYLFLIMVLCGACTQKKETFDSATLCGKITNATSEFNILSYSDKTDTCYLDAADEFKFNIDLKKGDYFRFVHGKENTTLYIAPGDSIFLLLNPEEFDESIEYSGTGAEKNNYLAQRFLLDESHQADMKNKWLLPPDSFLLAHESYNYSMKSLLDSFNNTHLLHQEFTKSEEMRLTIANAIEKMKYPSYHTYYAKKENVDLPENYYGFIDLIDLKEKTWFDIKGFNYYLKYLVNYKANILLESNKILNKRAHSQTLARLKVVPDLLDNIEERNKKLFDIMSDHVEYQDINNIDSLFNDFSLLCSDSVFIARIDSGIKSWQKLSQGMPAPGFNCVDADGKEYQLKDFQGKYVYLDIWATWCGPCRKEIPELEKLNHDYAGKNINIISISVDNTQEPWKEMLEERKLTGIQLYAPDAWKSEVAKAYKVRSIPRFILIDKEGKMINARAPQPSGNIREVLDRLEGI